MYNSSKVIWHFVELCQCCGISLPTKTWSASLRHTTSSAVLTPFIRNQGTI